MRLHEKTQRNIEIVLKEIEDGAESANDISKKTGIPLQHLYHYSRVGGFRYPKKKREIKRNPEIDRMVESVMSMGEMREITRYSRQRIHQYLHRTNQHEGYGRKKNYELLKNIGLE